MFLVIKNGTCLIAYGYQAEVSDEQTVGTIRLLGRPYLFQNHSKNSRDITKQKYIED